MPCRPRAMASRYSNTLHECYFIQIVNALFSFSTLFCFFFLLNRFVDDTHTHTLEDEYTRLTQQKLIDLYSLPYLCMHSEFSHGTLSSRRRYVVKTMLNMCHAIFNVFINFHLLIIWQCNNDESDIYMYVYYTFDGCSGTRIYIYDANCVRHSHRHALI